MNGRFSKLVLAKWLASRSGDTRKANSCRMDIRHNLRQGWKDYTPRGRGNKAWKRYEEVMKDYICLADYVTL